MKINCAEHGLTQATCRRCREQGEDIQRKALAAAEAETIEHYQTRRKAEEERDATRETIREFRLWLAMHGVWHPTERIWEFFTQRCYWLNEREKRDA